MTDDKPDTTTLSGAEFHRYAGTDPQKWAEGFIAAYDEAFLRVDDDPLIDRDERIAWVAPWLRDYAEVRVAEEVGRITARLVPRHDE
jgi:hypothetical protein